MQKNKKKVIGKIFQTKAWKVIFTWLVFIKKKISSWKILDILLFGLLISLIIISILLLKWKSFFLIILLLVNIFIYISYRYNISIPGVSKLSSYYVKKSVQDFSKINSAYFHYKILYYLVLLIHDIDSGFELLFKGQQDSSSAALAIHHKKKRRAVIFTIAPSVCLTIVILVSVFIFAMYAKAMTFGWVQDDWSGGAATSTAAVHPGDQTGWKKFASSTSISIVANKIQITSTSDSVTDSGTFSATSHSATPTGGVFSAGSLSTASLSGSTISLAPAPYWGNAFGLSTLARDPHAVTFDNVRNRVWVAQEGWGRYLAFNATTGAKILDVDAGGGDPMSLDYDSHNDVIWATFRSGNVLRKINAETGEKIADFVEQAQAYKGIYDAHNDAVWVVGSNALLEKFSAGSGTKLGSVTTHNDTRAVAYDPDLDMIWTADYSGSGIRRYQASDLSEKEYLGVGSNPDALAYDSTQRAIWVANWSSNTIQRISTSGTHTGDITINVGTNPSALQYDASDNSIWVTNWSSATVQKFNASTGAQIGDNFYTGNASAPSGLALQNNSNAHAIWVTNHGGNSVIQVMAATEKPAVVQSSVDIGRYAYSVAYDSTNNVVWTGSDDTKIKRWNADTGAQIGGDITPTGQVRDMIYIGGARNQIWATNWNGNNLQIYDASSLSNTLNIDTGRSNGDRLCYDSKNDAVWISFWGSAKIQEYSVGSHAKLREISTNSNPTDITCDPVNDIVWVTNEGNYLQRFKASDGTSAGSDITGVSNPKGVAYDSTQNAVWVVNWNSHYLQKFSATSGSQIGTDIRVGTTAGGNGEVLTKGIPYSVIYDATQNVVWVGLQDGTSGDDFEKYNAVDGTLLARISSGNIHPDGSRMVYDSYHNVIWSANYNGATNDNAHSTLTKITASSFVLSGNFTSNAVDFTKPVLIDTISWVPTSQSASLGANPLKFQIAANNDNATWNFVGPNGTANTYYTTTNEATNIATANRYIKYKAFFTSVSSNLTPIFNSVTVNYHSYASSASLISSKYNSTNVANLISKVSWTNTTTNDNQVVKLQVRTASTLAGLDSAPWCGYDDVDTCDGTHYFEAADNGVKIDATNPLMKSGSNQWFQYKVVLEGDGSGTPEVDSVNIVYVVNEKPEFEAPVTASQNANGTVDIHYSAKDVDTAEEGAACPNCVVTSFEVSIDGGSNWDPITAGLPANATGTTGITANFANYDVVWNAKAQLNGTDVADAQVRVTINDQEGGNNIATSTSSSFALDVKNPVVTSAKIIASESPITLHIDASDEHSPQMCISTTLADIDSHCSELSSTVPVTLGSYTRLYIKVVDAFKNANPFYVEVPETPSGMVIRDISDVVTTPDSPAYQELVAWKAIAGSFSKYHVLASVDDESNYQEVKFIEDRSINYFFHQNLDGNRTYYYKVYVENANGDTSQLSSAVSDLTDGVGGTNTTPPTISGVGFSNVTTQSATIEWDTNDLADSNVHFSAISAPPFTTTVGVPSLVDNAKSVARHHVVLTNLIPDTDYYFSVESQNALGIPATDDNGGGGYPFKTLDGPKITDVTPSQISNHSATIVWNTNIPADSYVYYSESTDFSSSPNAGMTGDVTTHSVSLPDLKLGTTYYYYVKSGIATDNKGGAYYTFDTSKDNVPPIISLVVSGIVTDTSALITWVTNELADSTINYGTAMGVYNATGTDGTLSLNHKILLSNLATSTTYYYMVTSSDSSGNSASYQEKTFKTLQKLSQESDVVERETAAEAAGEIVGATKTKPSGGGGGGGASIPTIDRTKPILSALDASVDGVNAKVTWKTNKKGNSSVRFGVSDSYGDETGIYDDSTTDHTVLLKNLSSSTLYHYRAASIDENGNLGTSDDGTFKTGLENLEISNYTIEKINGSTGIFKWLTNSDTDAEVKVTPFRNGVLAVDSSTTVKDKNFSTMHQIPVDIFESGIIYEVEMSGKDINGQIVSKKISSFSTGDDNFPPTISQVQTESALSVGKESNVQTIISWLTDEPATAQVFFQKGAGAVDENAWEKSQLDTNYSKKHIVVVTKFEPGQIYQFKLQSGDSNNNMATSRVYTIMAPKQKESVFQVIMKNFEDVFGWTQGAGK